MSADATVVVGGGIVGLACAYELASAGQEVHVVDRSTIGTGSPSPPPLVERIPETVAPPWTDLDF